MKITVELRAFGQRGEHRIVEVPDADIMGASTEQLLGATFHYGQNDFQPLPQPSVSVGDVIRLDGKRYRVDGVGFSEVSYLETVNGGASCR